SEPLALHGIKIEVTQATTWTQRAAVLSSLARCDELFPMVVFCVLRKHCAAVTALLKTFGLNAISYHAGMPAEQRSTVSNAFLCGGERSVLVATSAYEMGVNVPALRSVVHYGLPASLESYVQ